MRAFAFGLLLLLLHLPLASAAEGAVELDFDGGEEIDGEAEAAKVMLLQSSVGLSGPEAFVKADEAGRQRGSRACSNGQGVACTGQQLDEADGAEVMMLQAKMDLNEQEPPRIVATDLVSVLQEARSNASLDSGGVGSSACPCIGLTHQGGEIHVTINGKNATFPADLGSSCQYWDNLRHPECKSSNYPLLDPAWCLQKWCFVDPCNCNIKSPPKMSAYLKDAKIQDKHVYYSYEACGGIDTWTASGHGDACVNQKTAQECFTKPKCSWTLTKGCVGSELAGSLCNHRHLADATIWGRSECPCVGVANISGTVDGLIPIGNSTTATTFPVDIGATCKAWDDNRHPSCQGSGSKPSWCTKKWCLVDPCKCKLKTPPKLSTYFVGTKWLGHQVYYSYSSCGEKDDYTATHNKNACVNQKDQASCNALGGKCLWTVMDLKYVCLGKDLGNLCYKSAALAAQGGAERAAVALSLAPLLAALLGLSHL